MLFFQKHILFLFILSVSYAMSAYATELKPLWTPEDAVILPFVDIKDISSNGKHTIIQLLETSRKGQKEERHLHCILVDNDNLTQEIIGKSEDWCTGAHFLSSQDKISII